MLLDERRYLLWLVIGLFGVAVLSGAVGWQLYNRGVQPRVGSGFFDGLVAVYLSSSEPPIAGSQVGVLVTPSSGETRGDQYAINLRLEILAASFPGDRVRWAIALTDDAVLRVDTDAPTFGTVAGSSQAAREGALAADVDVLFATSPDRAVVIGEFRDRPGSAPATMWANVTIPLSRPFLFDSGETYALSTPDFGGFADRSVSQTGDIAGAAPDGLDRAFLARLQGPDTWSLPDSQSFTFTDIDRGGFQEFGTQPARHDVRSWSSVSAGAGARKFLKVDAMFTRPVEQEKQGRRLFLAGLLLSASATLGIWGLELLLGPERTPLLRRRRTSPRAS